MIRVWKLPEKFKQIAESLEDHLDVWKRDNEFMTKYRKVVEYIKTVLKLDISEDEALKVITRSYTNDFSHTLPNGNQVL